jgi:hypothetical protein
LALSGLETAIRNALEKSERSNPDVRARIYQSARQALDAGLKKQGISDEQVVLAQHQRLEQKIREIEFEERKAVAAAASTPAAATPPAAPRVASGGSACRDLTCSVSSCLPDCPTGLFGCFAGGAAFPRVSPAG